MEVECFSRGLELLLKQRLSSSFAEASELKGVLNRLAHRAHSKGYEITSPNLLTGIFMLPTSFLVLSQACVRIFCTHSVDAYKFRDDPLQCCRHSYVATWL